MSDRRQEIRNILFEHDLSRKWLQDKLPHLDIYYLLGDNSKRFDVKDYDEIIDVLKKEGFIVNDSERCDRLVTTVLQINSLIGNGLDLLNNAAQTFTIDRKLTPTEIHKLGILYDDLETKMITKFQESRKILGLR